jgi:hypothetical protein
MIDMTLRARHAPPTTNHPGCFMFHPDEPMGPSHCSCGNSNSNMTVEEATEAEPLSLYIARARVLLSRLSVFSLLPCLVRARLECARIWLPCLVLLCECSSSRDEKRKALSPAMAEPDPCVLGPCAAVQSYNSFYYTPGALARPLPTCGVPLWTSVITIVI